MIKGLGSITSAVASISVVLSVVYDWGYFSALNITFSSAPTTLSDHFSSWLIWLPFIIFPTILTVTLEFFTLRTEQGKSEEELLDSSPVPNLTRKTRERPFRFIRNMAYIGIILWVLFGTGVVKHEYLMFFLAITWMAYTGWVFSNQQIAVRYTYLFFLCFLWIPPAIMMVFSMGSSHADTEVARKKPNYQIIFNSNNTSPKINSEINLIRAFENWILVQDQNKEIHWVRLNDLKRIKPLIQEEKKFPGIICLFSNLFDDSVKYINYCRRLNK